MSLIGQYCQGEYQSTYSALISAGSRHPESRSVALEIMSRVRQNLEILARRWRSYGFVLENPFGEVEQAIFKLEEVEKHLGKFSTTLSAFYQTFEYINFIEHPPKFMGLEMDLEEFDPIAINSLDLTLENILEEYFNPEIDLFEDPDTKFGFSGVGSIYVKIDKSEFDSILYFEDDPLLYPNGTPIRFVSYLREIILSGGGMGMLVNKSNTQKRRKLLSELTRDLISF